MNVTDKALRIWLQVFIWGWVSLVISLVFGCSTNLALLMIIVPAIYLGYQSHGSQASKRKIVYTFKRLIGRA